MARPIKPTITLLLTVSIMWISFGMSGCGGKKPDYVNPELEKTVRQAANMGPGAQTTTSVETRRTLEKLATQDSGNALSLYLKAAAAAKLKDWNGAQAALEAGNAAPKCVEYQGAEAAFHVYPGLARLRALAREACQAAPSLGVVKGSKLLAATRQMGTRLTRMEPLETVCPLGGGGIRRMADKALVQILDSGGKKSDKEQARKRYEADRIWYEKAKTTVDAESPLDFGQKSAALADKYGITQAEFVAYGQNKPLSTESTKKFASFLKEINSTERAIAEKVLKTLPE